MMTPKGFAALLALLGLLFVCSLGVGLTRPQGAEADPVPPFVEALAALLGSDRGLRVEEIEGAAPPACLQQFEQGALVLPERVTCTFAVGASSAQVRTLPLRLTAGTSAGALAEPAGNTGLTARHVLDGTRPTADVQLFREGGTLRIVCITAGRDRACRLELRDG